MFKDLNKKSVAIQLVLGVCVYLLFFRSKPKKVGIIEVGEVAGEGSEYEPIYFKKNEFFKNLTPPEKYLKNYYKLMRILDSVRVQFGAPILISRGYEFNGSGVITSTFETCQSVVIFPQNGLNKQLFKVVEELLDSSQVMEKVLLPDQKIRITING